MDASKLQDMRSRVASLIPYRRNPRPVGADSFPPFVEQELQRASTTTTKIVQALRDLDERLAALEP